MSNRFVTHATTCETLLGMTSQLNNLNEEEKKLFKQALVENDLLMRDPHYNAYREQLKFYDDVIRQIIDNQIKFPRPPGP